MVVRIWKAQATDEGADKYRQHFEHNVMPALRDLSGFRQAYLLNRKEKNTVHVEVHTLWDSIEAIKAFARPDLEKAVVEPEAQAVLSGFDTTVSHFDATSY